MVHLQLSPSEWKKIPDAAKAVKAEFDQLEAIKAWDMDSVTSYDDVVARAKRTNKTVYFGRMFPLCHIKHSELAAEFHKYKGRVVLVVTTSEMKIICKQSLPNRELQHPTWFAPSSWMHWHVLQDVQVRTRTFARHTLRLS